MKKRKEVLFILLDIIERLKDTNDKITISELEKATAILSNHITDELVENLKQQNKEA
jgi:hypothetical protein|tara:strand:+ start:249 stop:419 length:171 start_codon:yes stop_codon:yes gene_type:complete